MSSSSFPPYFPNSASINSSGQLEVGGYNLVDLASRFGTPLYVLDEQTIRETAQSFKSALDKYYPNNLPIFASKSLCLQAVFSILQQEGFGLDVVSSGELYTAQSINFPAEKIYLHGNNKSLEELSMAADYKGSNGGSKVILDNFNDLELLKKIGKPVDALLRLTPGVECHTHEYIKTGHLDSKFGFDLDQIDDAIKQIKSISNINLIGLHAHIGSQIFETSPYQDAARILLEHFVKLKEKYGYEFTELNVGGGFGIHYTEADDPPAIDDVIGKLTSTVKSLLKEFSLGEPKLIIEPGRSMVGRAGVTLYTLGAKKEVPGVRNYISTDGGMADNPRPITYQAKYSACIANKANQEPDTLYTVAGRYCESGDVLIKDINLPASTESGDLLAVFGTGAYNYSMSSNYNRVPRPSMVLVHNGEAEIILQRENLEDLLRNDVLPSRLAKRREAVH
ncbi:MAG: diaminopimelate decarboxylase [Candidatus Caenarcaniphilales bacterium]|nr:diaminopimelate decarboxylase [Candidatus Caenarcaniphilales bacterium]